MNDTQLWDDSRIISEVDDALWEADAESRERARRLLRRLRDDCQAPAPAMPQWERDFPPEWDRHPWANWACLIVLQSALDGVTLRWDYFEVKPEWGKKSYNWVDGTHGFANPVTRAPLSLVFDTKDTLMQRPAPGAND